MAITIGSNIASLKALRRLDSTGGDLARSFERLSSGQRINRASDDAAGLAIADTLRVNQRLFSTALRNVNDGLSAIAIVDSGVGQQQRILERMTELAEQSANGVYSVTQRRALNIEYQQLAQEFGRLGDTTSFNGVELLLGGRGSNARTIGLQAGINGQAASRIDFDLFDTGTWSGILNLTDFTGSVASQDGFIDGADYDDFTNEVLAGTFLDTYKLAHTRTVRDSLGRDVEIAVVAIDAIDYGSDTEVLFNVAIKNPTTGEWAAPSSLTYGSGFSISFNSVTGEAQTETSGGASSPTPSFTFALAGATVNLSLDFRGLKLQPSSAEDQLSTTIDFTGVESVTRARRALDLLSRKRSELASILGRAGAIASRLGTASAVLSAQREAVAAGESRIRDVDVASESAQLTRQTILQQIGASVLAQANQQPALALQLLR